MWIKGTLINIKTSEFPNASSGWNKELTRSLSWYICLTFILWVWMNMHAHGDYVMWLMFYFCKWLSSERFIRVNLMAMFCCHGGVVLKFILFIRCAHCMHCPGSRTFINQGIRNHYLSLSIMRRWGVPKGHMMMEDLVTCMPGRIWSPHYIQRRIPILLMYLYNF